MSGVSLDGRDRRDRDPFWYPYRALTPMEWRSQRLSPVPCARARLSAGRGRRNEPDLMRMEKIADQGLWICG